MLAKKLQEIPENIRAKYPITPAMLLGLNNHSIYTLKEQIITWMIAKMRVRKAVISNSQDDNCKRFLQSTLWDSELFPDSAFTNLSNANHGRTDFRNLLKLSNKRQYTEYDHEAKKHKSNFNQDFEFSAPFRNPSNSRGSTYNRARGGRRGGGDRDANNRNASTRSSYGDGNPSSNGGSDRGSARGERRG